MKYQAGAILALLGASAAHAGGIERSTQSAMILYSEGTRVELSYGSVSPSLTGTDVATVDISNVGKTFGLPSFAVKTDVTDKIAVALIYDKPFGADIEYGSASPVLGGTMAQADVTALTLLAKYQFTERLSAFGGVRFQQADGEITLSGLAYSTLSGYNVELNDGSGTGYVLGGAYEIPEIALRVALTYNSAIEHEFDTVEYNPMIGSGLTSTLKSKTPESWNLEFQTGVAADTLLFGSVRYAKHSQFKVDPTYGPDLVDLDDTTTYRIGVGRRFNPKLSGSISVAYEAAGDKLVSPLAPSTGSTSVSLGLAYKVTEQLEISGGISKIWLGDADPETGTPDVARAYFTDNDATAIGLKIAYTF